MDPVTAFLLSLAGIFLIGAVGEIIFQRTNIPDVVWLILAGILLGPVLSLVTRDVLQSIAPYFAAITLVVVLFEGGSRLKLSELSGAAPRSGLLATLTFATSVLVIGVLSMGAAAIGLLPGVWTWSHGWLLGCILGGSSSIIIMPAMAQARLPARLANLVNLESALTDAFCVVGTAALVDIQVQGSAGAAGPAVSLVKSFGIGLCIGAVAGLVWILFLRFLRSNEHAYPVTLAALLILYVVIDHAGGSAALGILTVAIILGNAGPISQKIGLAEPVELDTDVRGFHKQVAFIIKSFFFVFIGAMLGPPWSLMLLGVLLGGALLAARLPGVAVGTWRSDFTRADKQMIAVSMPRGMAAGVLATLPGAAGVEGTRELPSLVFACVLTTILIFAAGFPWARRRMPAATGAATRAESPELTADEAGVVAIVSGTSALVPERAHPFAPERPASQPTAPPSHPVESPVESPADTAAPALGLEPSLTSEPHLPPRAPNPNDSGKS